MASGTQATLRAVAFPDESTSVAVGDGGTILVSSDRGQSWQARQSGTWAALRGVHGWVAVLAPVGRMGLTNYLMQSVIMTTLLYGRGFGLEPHLRNWWGILVLQVVFVVQVLYSRWWLARFRFGPVEWAWRSLTWMRLQPMRISASPEAAAGMEKPVPAT